MPRKWSLRAGKRLYQREVFEYFFWLWHSTRTQKATAAVAERTERWLVFLGGMEAALGLNKKAIRKVQSQARRQAQRKLKQYWKG